MNGKLTRKLQGTLIPTGSVGACADVIRVNVKVYGRNIQTHLQANGS